MTEVERRLEKIAMDLPHISHGIPDHIEDADWWTGIEFGLDELWPDLSREAKLAAIIVTNRFVDYMESSGYG